MEKVPISSNAELERLTSLMLAQYQDLAIILLDPEGRVVGWLAGAERTFGYTAAEMTGNTLHRLFTKEDVERGIPEHELKVAAANGRAEDDRWQLRKDETRIWLMGTAAALRDENGKLVGFVKATRDRTDQKALIDALENQVAALTSAEKRKNIFLSTLAHELRNPLAPLTNAVELFRLAVPNSSELTYPVKLVERQVSFIKQLVDDLSDVTRIGAGKVRLKFAAVSVEALARQAAETCRALIDLKRHNLQILLPDQPIVLEGDADRLHQVLVNLLNNAAKYTDEGGKIWLKGTIEGDEAVIRVQDNGVGISAEMLPHIFELFTQVEASLDRSAGGLGIGLSLVKELVTLHHGSVQVLSDGPGGGSEFTIRLPLRQPSTA